MSVVIETTLGDITVDLFLGERPRACLNFLKLCKLKYYNYHLFHTISRGFIAQTGDPTGSRKGGESLYGVIDGPERRYFEAENEPRIKHTKMGLISFVGNEDHMIGSQFFITLGEDLTYLDQKHCVFGEVVEGFEILEIINEVICDTDDRPYQDVRVTHTVILDDPYPDPKRLIVPSRSPSPSAERLQGGRIAPDEDIDETEGKTAQEIAELQAECEAKARATILEMVGDLPDADMAPPENVLFVCKLNPITTDDDLEIIFNRFGKIVSCEVIRDRKTGDSLQYAFIEFEDRKSCEDAYFKMDNILIDDRRIHVDFSQSVSKVKWHGKGRGVTHYDEKGRKTTQGRNDIGKGNYKISGRHQPSSSKNVEREKNSHRNTYRKETSNTSNDSKRKEDPRSRSPHKNFSKDNGARKSKNGRDYIDKSLTGSNSPPRREESSNTKEVFRRERNYRSHSRSPRRTDHRRERDSNRYRYNSRREESSKDSYENRRRFKSRSPDRERFGQNASSSKYPERERKTEDRRERSNYKHYDIKDKSYFDIEIKNSKEETKKLAKYESQTKRQSEFKEIKSSKSKENRGINKDGKNINEKKKNRIISSDSDTESDSSKNENRKSKKYKKHSSAHKKSFKKKVSSGSESDSSEDSNSSESESSESEYEKRNQKTKLVVKTKTNSESERSEKDRRNKRKKERAKN